MKQILSTALFISLFVQLQAQTDSQRLSTFQIDSEILHETRSCLVSLPASYEENSEKNYPVMILLDGNAHFSIAGGISDFLSSGRLRNAAIPELIIVAIENVDRERDFTITKLQTTRKNTMGGGRNFLAFMEQELLPHINKIYQTNGLKILGGHSLGAQLAINAFRDSESTFDGFIAIDPALWWDEPTTVQKVDSITIEAFRKPLFIATANQNPARAAGNKDRHEYLYYLMKSKAGSTFKVEHMIFDEENHRSVPFLGLYYGLKYVFKPEE